MGVRVTWVLFYGGGKNDLFHDVSNNDFTSTYVGGSAHRGQMIAHDTCFPSNYYCCYYWYYDKRLR